MLLDQSGALIEYLCDGSNDLVITDGDAYSSLLIKLLLINLCFGTAFADNL